MRTRKIIDGLETVLLSGAEASVEPDRRELVAEVTEINGILSTIRRGKLRWHENVKREQLDLGKLVGCLNDREAEYVIVGGYAVAFHGVPRATRDIDFFYHRTPDNVDRILAAFKDCGLDLDITPDDLLQPTVNYKIGYQPNQADFNPDVKGITWEEAVSGAEAGEILGHQARFLDFDTLIRSKRAAGRPEDLFDIEKLMKHIGEV